ncbi:MBL fold metallo-hydrolase [Candidatus Neomarinimicrobiota bacterium]
MKLRIHRGTHEIGGSCIEVWTNTTRIILDMGMPLVGNDGASFDSRVLEGKSTIELIEKGILPGVGGLYHEDKDRPVDGVILSHPHQDHYGFLNYLGSDIPVHLSEPAHILIDITRMFTGRGVQLKKVVYFEHEDTITIGDLTITPYLQDHSAFSAFGFHITDGIKSLYYTGDFRGHGRKGKLIQYMRNSFPSDIDALLMEGTNVSHSVNPARSESVLEDDLKEILNNNEGGLTLFAASGQNIDRLVTYFRAAKGTGMELVIDLYTAYVLYKLGEFNPSLPRPASNWTNLRVFYIQHHANALVDANLRSILYRFRRWKIEVDEIEKEPGKFVMLIRPGKYLKPFIQRFIGKANKYIYSLWAGYQEQESTQQFTKFLADHGFEYTELHTSGHADISTLKEMVEITKPQLIIPLHTFEPEAFQQHFAQPVRVLEDGEIFRL